MLLAPGAFLPKLLPAQVWTAKIASGTLLRAAARLHPEKNSANPWPSEFDFPKIASGPGLFSKITSFLLPERVQSQKLLIFCFRNASGTDAGILPGHCSARAPAALPRKFSPALGVPGAILENCFRLPGCSQKLLPALAVSGKLLPAPGVRFSKIASGARGPGRYSGKLLPAPGPCFSKIASGSPAPGCNSPKLLPACGVQILKIASGSRASQVQVAKIAPGSQAPGCSGAQIPKVNFQNSFQPAEPLISQDNSERAQKLSTDWFRRSTAQGLAAADPLQGAPEALEAPARCPWHTPWMSLCKHPYKTSSIQGNPPTERGCLTPLAKPNRACQLAAMPPSPSKMYGSMPWKPMVTQGCNCAHSDCTPCSPMPTQTRPRKLCQEKHAKKH